MQKKMKWWNKIIPTEKNVVRHTPQACDNKTRMFASENKKKDDERAWE